MRTMYLRLYLHFNMCITYQVIGEQDLCISRILSFACQCDSQDSSCMAITTYCTQKVVLLHEPRFLWFGRMNRLQKSPRWGHS